MADAPKIAAAKTIFFIGVFSICGSDDDPFGQNTQARSLFPEIMQLIFLNIWQSGALRLILCGAGAM
jgi:hypothetical protein